MKKSTVYFAILGLIIFSASCSKSGDSKPPGKKITIEVVEFKTDTPIIGALVEYYKKCPGCMPGGYTLVFSDRTGYGGACEVPEDIFNNISYGIQITPPTPLSQPPGIDYYYWPTGSPAEHSTSRKYFLPITGEEKLHLVKINSFPKGYYLELKGRGEKSTLQVIDIASINALPSDTSFSFYTYRAQTNTITWNIYDSTNAVIASGGPLMFDFPKVGIQEIEIKY